MSPTLVKYTFLSVWFFTVPLVLAIVVVQLLKAPDTATASALGSLIREQPIPAGIVLFTIFEMTLYSFRHRLPLADQLAVGGREGLPNSVRREYEAAAHLIEEVERLQRKRTKAIERAVPAKKRTELDDSLDHLRGAMDADPFDENDFLESYDHSLERAKVLDPWRKGEVREYVESIGIAVLVALLLRAVVVEAFKIPSGSMLPTLQIDDHIFVNKFVYGPTIPFTRTRVLPSLPPERGDVIVFQFPDPDPSSPKQDFIKRVIALPGDVLEADSGHPIINGWRVPSCRVGTYEFDERRGFGSGQTGELFVEFLGEHSYLTLFETGHLESLQGPYAVEPGEVWVFGDNRHNSSDSRAWFGGRGGGVPYPNLKGRAMFAWYPMGRLFVNVMGSPVLPADAPADLVDGIRRCLSQRPANTNPPSP